MPTHAIIPVKQLHESKRRLEHLLSPDERAELIGRFLDNLLLTLSAAPVIDRVLVVTCDPQVVGLARRHGADVLVEAAADGLNAAVERGVVRAVDEGATAVLVVPADLPFARVEDIESMLQPLTADRRPLEEGPGVRVQGLEVQGVPPLLRSPAPLRPLPNPLPEGEETVMVICPDEAEDGTNALLLAPPGGFTFHYGPDSFRAHLAEAERNGRAISIVHAPGLRFDLDTESDWLVYNGYLVQVAEE